MKSRYTTKELKEFSDNRMILCLLNERLAELNRYSPLSKRLRAVREKIDDAVDIENRVIKELRAIPTLIEKEKTL